MDSHSRRRFIQLSAATTATLLAGCNTTQSRDTTTASHSTEQPTTQGTTADPEALQETISDLEKRVAELEGKVFKYEAQLERKREKIQKQKREIRELDNELNNTESNLQAVRSKLDDTETNVEELEAELARTGSYQYSESVRETALEVGKQVREAVVALEFEYEYSRRVAGTGWFIDENHIITNAHILRRLENGVASNPTAYTLDGTEIPIEVGGLAEFDGPDIGLATTSASAPRTLNPGSTEDLSAGEPLIQVGHPGMIGNWVIGLGEFLALKYNGTVTSEMPSTSGNSGSPVVTLDGTVIGVHYAVGSREIGQIDADPEPVDAELYEDYPYQARTEALAEPIETVQDQYQDWI